MLSLRQIVCLLTLYVTTLQASIIFHAGNIPGTNPISGGSPLSQCDVDEEQLLEVNNIFLTPNPPRRGKDLDITATGELLVLVEEGAYVDVEVRFGYIKLLTQTFDLCEVLEENDIEGLTCPIAPGVYDIKKIVQIPKEVPPGKYTVLARAYTADDDLLSCITGDIIFQPRI